MTLLSTEQEIQISKITKMQGSKKEATLLIFHWILIYLIYKIVAKQCEE